MARLFSNRKNIRKAKEAAGGAQLAGIIGMESVAAEKARAQAMENAKMSVFQRLGSDGSYSQQNLFDQNWQNSNNVDNPDSLFDTSGFGLSQPDQHLMNLGPNAVGRKDVLGVARSGILDADSYANAIAGTAQFRIASKRVSEAEQLLNQEGPAWDMMNNSILGIINEGSALQQRDQLRLLKNQYAKGGTARRAAMFEANEMALGERAMRMRVQETWQANLGMYDTIHKIVDSAQQFSNTFMQNLPLVNDQYRAAMMHTAEMQIEASKLAMTSTLNAYNTKMTQQPQNFGTNLLEGIIKLVPTAVATYFGGPMAGKAVSDTMNAADGSGSGYQGGSDLLGSGMDYLKQSMGGSGLMDEGVLQGPTGPDGQTPYDATSAYQRLTGGWDAAPETDAWDTTGMASQLTSGY
jgi:hypothetical protein